MPYGFIYDNIQTPIAHCFVFVLDTSMQLRRKVDQFSFSFLFRESNSRKFAFAGWEFWLFSLGTPGANNVVSMIEWHGVVVCFSRMVPNIELRGLSLHGTLIRYVKLRVAHAPGMRGTFSLPPRVSDPDMYHGTRIRHMPWCMPGSLTSGFLWSRWWKKRSQHPRRMHNPQFYVSSKKTIVYNGKRCSSKHRNEQLWWHLMSNIWLSANAFVSTDVLIIASTVNEAQICLFITLSTANSFPFLDFS